MNVLQLISNKVWGGGERYALDLSRALAADGHSVGVITRRCAAVDEPFAAAGFVPGHLPLGGVLDFYSPLQLARVLNRIDGPVVVHCHNFKTARTAVWARRLSRRAGSVKIVVTRHLARPAATSASAAELYGAIDALIFVSDYARRTFMSTSPTVDAEKVHVVPNALASPPPLTEKSSGAPVEILYLGRIDPEKGLDVLIDALAKLPPDLPEWQLTVAGTGTARDVMPLVRLSRQTGIDSRIDWKGFVSDPSALLASAHIGVLPTRAPEAFGLALLEYMHSGCVPVTSDSGAQPEIVTDGVDGAVFAAGDAAALADALTPLIADSALRHRLGLAAAQTARSRFNYHDFYNDITKIYRATIAP